MTKMTFVAEIDGRERTVIVDNHDQDDGFYTMTLDGVDYQVDAQLMRSHIVSMLIDHRSYDVDIEKTGDPFNTLDGRLAARVRGRVLRFEMLDERRRKMKAAASGQFGGGAGASIESPMPGKVIKLLLKEGDSVEAGQGVVVVEAMKMENELKAAAAGTVGRVHVKEGDTVDSGTLLVEIEPAA